jgi:chromosomal replication initiator protein
MDKNFRAVVEEILGEIAAESSVPSEVPRTVQFVTRSEALAVAENAVDEPGDGESDTRSAAPRPTVERTKPPRPARRQPARPTAVPTDATLPSARDFASHPVLDPRYTFDNFVVGSCNQFAHAAARAVADGPGRSYNPLYLYGGVGLGKTHLMQAIGHALRGGDAHLRVAYVSAERFMCEMVNAIRYKRTPEFRDKFRSTDVLLVDDIQFLEGKEATQEEFFHTFRSLYEEGKQVVLSSDCPPRELATLEERLRSRFESGLIADMQVPDLETKLAILRRKADACSANLPDEVTLFIASKVRSNVRELEGCLTRLLALAALRKTQADIELAKEATRDLFPGEDQPVSMEAIQRFVADHYRVKVSDLKARNNARVVAFPRQVAMYLCKKMTRSSFPDIGKKFGGKHHSTVIHSVNKIARQAAQSDDFNHLLNRFIQEIQ